METIQPSESKIPSTLGPETQSSLLFPSPVAILSTSCPAPDQEGTKKDLQKICWELQDPESWGSAGKGRAHPTGCGPPS